MVIIRPYEDGTKGFLFHFSVRYFDPLLALVLRLILRGVFDFPLYPCIFLVFGLGFGFFTEICCRCLPLTRVGWFPTFTFFRGVLPVCCTVFNSAPFSFSLAVF